MYPGPCDSYAPRVTVSELGRSHVSVTVVRVAVLCRFCGIRVAMHTPLTDHTLTADASVRTPTNHYLSGSAHPERCSATLEALLGNNSAHSVPDEDSESRPRQPLPRPSAVTSDVLDVGSGSPVMSTALVVPPERKLEGTPQVVRQGIGVASAVHACATARFGALGIAF